MIITLDCDCEPDAEHEVEVFAEVNQFGPGSGIYSPEIGDELPCGRKINERDMDKLYKRLEEWGKE